MYVSKDASNYFLVHSNAKKVSKVQKRNIFLILHFGRQTNCIWQPLFSRPWLHYCLDVITDWHSKAKTNMIIVIRSNFFTEKFELQRIKKKVYLSVCFSFDFWLYFPRKRTLCPPCFAFFFVIINPLRKKHFYFESTWLWVKMHYK